MKSVLISIQPRWCELIISGKKTVEVRKTRPKLEMPFKVYIYCTKNKEKLIDVIHEGDEVYGFVHEGKPNFIKIPDENSTIYGMFKGGKIVGEFICRKIDIHSIRDLVIKEDAESALKGTCLGKVDVLKYIGYPSGTDIYAKPYMFYGWCITDLVVYDTPRELSDFARACNGENAFGCTECEYFRLLENPYYKCLCNHLKPLTRPPQSWCYIEEGGTSK